MTDTVSAVDSVRVAGPVEQPHAADTLAAAPATLAAEFEDGGNINPLVTRSSSTDSTSRTSGTLEAASASLSSLSDNTMERQESMDSVTSVDSNYSDSSTEGGVGSPPPAPRSPPDSPGSPGSPRRPKLKHRDSFMVAVESGHQHGHFMNVHAPKEDQYVEPEHTSKHKKTIEKANQKAGVNPRAGQTLQKQPSLLRTQSAFQIGKKRSRSGRKLMFDDDTLNGSRPSKPLEKTTFATNLHYCHDPDYDDEMYSPRGRACCTVS